MNLLLFLPAAAAAVAGIVSFTAPTGDAAAPAQDDAALGQELFVTQCASCHGVDGRGVEGRGPTLYDEGEAAVGLRAAHRSDADGRTRTCRPSGDRSATATPRSGRS